MGCQMAGDSWRGRQLVETAGKWCQLACGRGVMLGMRQLAGASWLVYCSCAGVCQLAG